MVDASMATMATMAGMHAVEHDSDEWPDADALPSYTFAKVASMAGEACPLFFGLVVCHIVLYVIVRKVTGGDWEPKTGGSDGCSGPSIIAYNGMVLIFDVVSTLIGMCALLDGTMAGIDDSSWTRLYGYSSTFMVLCALTAAFELYNTIVSAFVVPQGAALIAHHLVTLALCVIGVAPYSHFYGLFFFGIANLSSVPLAAFSICDALRSRYPAFEKAYAHLRTAFGVLFLVVRCAAWPVLSAIFWADTYSAMRAERVHSFAATLFLLLSNIFLTGLQFLWGCAYESAPAYTPYSAPLRHTLQRSLAA